MKCIREKLQLKMPLKEIVAVKRRALARRQKLSICFNSEVPPHAPFRQSDSLVPSTETSQAPAQFPECRQIPTASPSFSVRLRYHYSFLDIANIPLPQHLISYVSFCE